MFSQPRVFECLEDLSKVMVEGQLTREKDRPQLEDALVSNPLEGVCGSKQSLSPCPFLPLFFRAHTYVCLGYSRIYGLYLSARVCIRGAHVIALARDLTDVSLSPSQNQGLRKYLKANECEVDEAPAAPKKACVVGTPDRHSRSALPVGTPDRVRVGSTGWELCSSRCRTL